MTGARSSAVGCRVRGSKLRIFTAEEGAADHMGLDHLPHVSTFIADRVADMVAELTAGQR